jgi:hypothetical protein
MQDFRRPATICSHFDPAILITEVATTESDSRLTHSTNVVPISRGNWDGRPGPCSHNGERIGR